MTPDLVRYSTDPLAFIADLTLPIPGRPRFGDVWADFQRETFETLVPSLLAVARGEVPPATRFWIERTKGGSKDFDVAACLLWLLAFAKRPLYIQAGADDRDQAAETRKATKEWLSTNAWLASRVQVFEWKIACEATRSVCEIIATDASSAHGSRPDVLILNELSHIGSQDFAATLMDNATKIPHCLALVATNAGHQGTWQHRWRQLALNSERWRIHVWNHPSPWLTPADVAEAEQRNPAGRFRRLYYGEWVSDAGEMLPFVEQAVILDGPTLTAEPGWTYAAGLDASLRRDATALAIVGAKPGEKLKLCLCRSWLPTGGREVQGAELEAAVLEANERYRLRSVRYDPFMPEYSAQKLVGRGVPMKPFPFAPSNIDLLARTMWRAFHEQRVELYQAPGLVEDLQAMFITERGLNALGLKLPRNETGHCDRAVGLALAVCELLPMAYQSTGPSTMIGDPIYIADWQGNSIHGGSAGEVDQRVWQAHCRERDARLADRTQSYMRRLSRFARLLQSPIGRKP